MDERQTRRGRRACSGRGIEIVAIGVFLSCCRLAFALNPSLDINQYAHTAWKIPDDALKGRVSAIAQAPDGYLWLGTEFGLLRFDGVRFVPWQPPAGQQLPGSYIISLYFSRDGRLWIGTDKGLASWKQGKLNSYAELAGQRVNAIVEDREGTVWLACQIPFHGKLCAVQSGIVRCYGQDGSLDPGVFSLYEDGRYVWAGGATGVWRWKPGPPKFYPAGETNNLTSDKGRLILATRKGIFQVVDERAEPYPIPIAGQHFRPTWLLSDRDGGLWIGTTDQGLLHLHQGRTDLYARPDGLSGDYVVGLFEDREGDIWVRTADGLDRFRDFAIPTISVKQGLSGDPRSVLVARDGSVWLGTSDGLDHWDKGQITAYRSGNGAPHDVQSVFYDDRQQLWVFFMGGGVSRFEHDRLIRVSSVPGGYVWSIAGNAENLWISSLYEGLLHVRGESLSERIPWARLGRTDPATALLDDRSRGGLWLGFFNGGLEYLKDGRVLASYAEGDGLGGGEVASLQLDRDGTLWAGTAGGLSRIKNGRIATISSKNGLPCDIVHWAVEDDDHFLWLSMACGLVRIARPELDAWVANSKHTIESTVLDASDGIRIYSSAAITLSPTVAKAADGKLWFVAGTGLSVLDPRHLSSNKLLPPVHIEEITADRKVRWQNLSGTVVSDLRLPALSHDLEIDYTALSLVAPEKVRFKYKLEGEDKDWQDAGNRRQAFYTDLGPRHYRFRVMASNNSGVWNETGDTLEFSIDPAYYQTNWFRALCVAVGLAMLWRLHRYRLQQAAKEFNAELEGRVGERMRIARELHDTLLQSFQAVLLQFHALSYLLDRPAEARKKLETVVEQAMGAINEGREAIRGMRSSAEITNDLAKGFYAVGSELASEGTAEFRVVVEGLSRDLHPILRDEVYRIASEAIRNAFRHAQAKVIEAEIGYRDSLRVRIRDDGKGMDAATVEAGRSGHYGLSGMRERATRIGGKLNVWSSPGTGTEIELIIPGLIAYGVSGGRSLMGLFRSRGKANRAPRA